MSHNANSFENFPPLPAQESASDVPRDVRQLIIDAQVDRFHVEYAEFFHIDASRPTVEFFFEKVYALEGKEERDRLAKNTVQKVRHFIKDSTRHKLDGLIYLNDLTDYLDLRMARLFLVGGGRSGDTLDSVAYERLYSRLDNREERLRQLEVLLLNFRTFFTLSRRPVVRFMLKPMKFAARSLGAGILYDLFEQAYEASLSLPEDLFHRFCDRVAEVERAYIDRLLPGENKAAQHGASHRR